MPEGLMRITKIFVPLDLDQNSQNIVDYSLFVARTFDAEVVFFHAVEFTTSGEMALGNLAYDDINTTRLEAVREQLAKITRNAHDKCKKCSYHAFIGDVVDEILDYAQKEQADIIIMGTRSKRGIKKVLLGSVAERVLKKAHCPVMVVKP